MPSVPLVMRRPLSLAALLACLIALAVPAAAAASPGWTSPADVPDSAVGYQPKVALDSRGGAIAIFNAGAAVSVAERPPGGGWSEPRQIAADGFHPEVALGAGGIAVAVWAQHGTSESEVWSATRGSDGQWSEAEQLSAADAGAWEPRAVVDRAGNATVVWIQDCSIYSARRPARGEWSLPVEVWTDEAERCEIGDDLSQQSALDVGVDAVGTVTAAWRSGYEYAQYFPETRAIRTAVRPAGGSSDWAEARTLDESDDVRAPQLAVWHDGRAIVTWGIVDAGARAAARPAGVDEPWSATPVELSTEGSTDPAPAYDGHGNATVAWGQPAAAPNPATVQVATLDADGSWSGPATAATIAAGQQATNPRVAVSYDGTATLAWTRDGDDERVVQSTRRPAGGAWEAVVTLGEETSADTDPRPAALAGDPLGNALLAWIDLGSASWGEASVVRTVDYGAVPPAQADWTANGLTGSLNLRSWIDYVHAGGGAVEPSAGASQPDPDDGYSYRWPTTDAWIEQSTGETVVRLGGTIRFHYPDHYIDIRIADPRVVIAPDGESGRIVADGQGSGDMASAMAGNPQVEPFEDLHLLDLDPPAPIVSRDGSTRSWVGMPVAVAAGEAERHLSYSAGTAYGFLTVTAPAELPVRDTLTSDRDGDDERGGDGEDEGDGGHGPRDEADGDDRGRAPVGRRMPRIAGVRRLQRLRRRGMVRIGRVACPGRPCRIVVRRRVAVRIAGRRYGARVLAPRGLRAGRRAPLRVRLPRRAVRRLHRTRGIARVRVRVAVRAAGGQRRARRLVVRVGTRRAIRRLKARRRVRARQRAPRRQHGRSRGDGRSRRPGSSAG